MSDSSPLARYLVPLQRWWPVLACTLALALVIAWVTLPEPADQPDWAEVEDPEVAYRSTEILIRGRSTPTTANFDLVLLLAQQGELANIVLERMDGRVDIADIEAVELSPDSSLGTLSVTAVQPTPEQSVELVETYSGALTDFFDDRADASIEAQIDRSTERLALIDERIRTLTSDIAGLPEDAVDRRLLESEVVVLIDQYGALRSEVRDLSLEDLGAEPSFETLQAPTPVSTAASEVAQVFEVPETSPARFAIAVVAALILGVAAIFAVDWVDMRIRTRRDAEESFGLPVIAELPHRSRSERTAHPLPAATSPSSATAEGLRTLRLSVEKSPIWRLEHAAPISNGHVGTATAAAGGSRRVLLVSSTQNGEGKSTVAANLAATFAASGSSVLVIDCDFRRSSISELLGVEPGLGLRDLPSPTREGLAGLVRATTVDNVRLIRSGSTGIAPPWFLMDSSPLLELAQGLADVVILDTGPLLATNEAASLIPHVDALLLVTRSGRIARDQARRTTEQLSRLSARVAGVVMVGAEGSRRYGYYEPIRKAAERGEKLEPDGSSTSWMANHPKAYPESGSQLPTVTRTLPTERKRYPRRRRGS